MPGVGRNQLATPPCKELLTQLVFELLQLEADRGLGDEVFGGGGTYATQPDGRSEVSELADFHKQC